jgi:tetratricopeptide (TPR) repeat protein
MPTFRDKPLPALLVGLQRDSWSGGLVLTRGAQVKRVEWRRGAPVGVRSKLPGEQLGEILVASGALSREARARVDQVIERRGVSELQALASAGVPPRALLLGLAEQLRRGLGECLGWREGGFRLEPGETGGAAPALPFDLLALVAEEVGRSWQLHEVLVALGAHALTYPTLVPGLQLSWVDAALAERLVARLDGRTATFALLNELADVRAAAALWILDELGALVHRNAPGAAAPGAAAASDTIEIVVRGEAQSAGPAAAAAKAHAPAAGAGAAGATLRQEIRELHQRLGSLQLWEVLGVARNANEREVRRAYLGAAKRLHPDRVVQLGLTDLKTEANEVFAEITRAHEVLSDPERRRHYEETLVDAASADGDRIVEAEASYRRGDMLLRAGNFRGALELLERAVQLWPEEGEYHAALAWALHRKTPPESARAWEHFERALALGEQAVWLLRASLVAKELGHEARSADLAARARALDPNVKA